MGCSRYPVCQCLRWSWCLLLEWYHEHLFCGCKSPLYQKPINRNGVSTDVSHISPPADQTRILSKGRAATSRWNQCRPYDNAAGWFCIDLTHRRAAVCALQRLQEQQSSSSIIISRSSTSHIWQYRHSTDGEDPKSDRFGAFLPPPRKRKEHQQKLRVQWDLVESFSLDEGKRDCFFDADWGIVSRI